MSQTLAEYMQELMDDPTLALAPADSGKPVEPDHIESIFDCCEDINE